MLLRKGSRGQEVRELQQRLVSLGYNTNGIDGIFGNGTDRAVRQFQRDNNLVVDGIVGPATLGKLNIAPSSPTNYRKIRRFNSDVHIYTADKNCFVDVDLGARGKLERLSAIVNNHLRAGKKVLAGTNCGFFNFSGKPEHLGMLIDEGLYYSQPSKSFIDFIYYKDGTTEIKNLHGYNKELLVGLQKNAYWAIGTSYSLIQKGKIDLENSNTFGHSRNREPRTLLGHRKNGDFVLVVVDGRRTSSRGVTAKQSAEIMKELGCYNAVNLDGGGSSSMVLVRNGKAQVVNRPSGGSERAIGSCLLVLQK